MTAPSPDQLATSPPACDITVNGAALDSSYQVLSVETWSGVNKLPRARLILSDGSAADETFAISESAALIPGVALTIAIGYGASRTQIFGGVIVRQGLEASVDGPSRLVVEASDKAMAMTIARQNAIFENSTDSAMIEKLISAAGLSPVVTSTSTQYPVIVQYYATAWDLMILRAQANGMVVTVADGKVTVAPPKTDASPVLTLTYGQSILDLRTELDAAPQLAASAISSFGWDPATQALVQSSSASASVTTPGNLSSATLAGVFGISPYWQQSGGELQQAELTAWSSAELMMRELAKVRGQIRFQGSALAVPGAMVALAGLGARFNGNGYVSAVHHRLSEGLWKTTVDIGLSPASFAETAANVAAAGASGRLPPINNLQTGIVKQIDQDPDGEFRVLVTLPLLQAQGGSGVWARFGSFYASNGIGSNFYPEIGDEVVLSFLNGDPRYPVILGSLYSKTRPPPYPPTSGGDAAPNNVKSFMTKSKLHIDFIEDSPELLITTPAKQSISLNDKTKAITITDANGNSITLNDHGITLNSASDISLTASGAIKLSAGSDVTISASASLTASASASAKLTADGAVQIKGATVALNP
ncbi:type VI secretion system tip protein VgrG [Sphingomonas sp.]|jgi:Rhs element Vgr protein|uniref:type VI secretion system tip protein VgrG n=1 Tax=Sphingomonas sp. TaxID=28214 RepID=UPI00307F0B51